MIRSLSLLAMVSLPLAPAVAQDALGDLTLYEPDGRQTHVVPIQSFYFGLKPAGASDDPEAARTITMTGVARAPDPALLTWLAGPDGKRRVVLHIRDRDDAPAASIYELADCSLVGLSFGISDPGNGQQTMMLKADHLTINGLAVY